MQSRPKSLEKVESAYQLLQLIQKIKEVDFFEVMEGSAQFFASIRRVRNFFEEINKFNQFCFHQDSKIDKTTFPQANVVRNGMTHASFALVNHKKSIGVFTLDTLPLLESFFQDIVNDTLKAGRHMKDAINHSAIGELVRPWPTTEGDQRKIAEQSQAYVNYGIQQAENLKLFAKKMKDPYHVEAASFCYENFLETIFLVADKQKVDGLALVRDVSLSLLPHYQDLIEARRRERNDHAHGCDVIDLKALTRFAVSQNLFSFLQELKRILPNLHGTMDFIGINVSPSVQKRIAAIAAPRFGALLDKLDACQASAGSSDDSAVAGGARVTESVVLQKSNAELLDDFEKSFEKDGIALLSDDASEPEDLANSSASASIVVKPAQEMVKRRLDPLPSKKQKLFALEEQDSAKPIVAPANLLFQDDSAVQTNQDETPISAVAELTSEAPTKSEGSNRSCRLGP